jgi:hypothetical protein
MKSCSPQRIALRNEDHVSREATFEFLDAIPYYESEQPGLGQRFKDEVDRSLIK